MKPKTQKPKKSKIPTKTKVAFAIFMEATPKLIALWQSSKSYPEVTFDKWLMDIYLAHKNSKERS